MGKRWKEAETEDETDGEGDVEEVESDEETSSTPQESGEEAEGNEETGSGLQVSTKAAQEKGQPAAPGSLLLELLRPASPDAQQKVMSVLRNLEEVHFVGFRMGKEESAAIGTVLSTSAQLRAIKIHSHKDSFAPLLMAFAPGGGFGLRELHFATEADFGGGGDDVNDEHTVEAMAGIGKLPSLDCLSLSLPLEAESIDELFSPLSSLTALTSLTISDNGRFGDQQFVDFSRVLQHMQYLKCLSLPQIARPTLAILPKMIEVLEDTGLHDYDIDILGSDLLLEILSDVASNAHRFPKLHTFVIHNMPFGGGPENSNWQALFSQTLAALSHIRLCMKSTGAYDFPDLLRFLFHTREQLAISVGILDAGFFAFYPIGSPDKCEDEDEDSDRSWAARFAHLGDLCPSLTGLRVTFTCLKDLDIEPILQACQLSSLQELEMVSTMGLSVTHRQDLVKYAEKLLTLARSMSFSQGSCLLIVLKFEGLLSEQEDVEAGGKN